MTEKNSHVHGPAGTFPSPKLNVNNRTDVQRIINSKVHADHHHHHHSGTKSEIILEPQPSSILMLRCGGVGREARTQLLQCGVRRHHTGNLIVYTQSVQLHQLHNIIHRHRQSSENIYKNYLQLSIKIISHL